MAKEKLRAARKRFVLRAGDKHPDAAALSAALEREVRLPDAVAVPVAAPLRRDDLHRMEALVEGDSFRITQPMLQLLHQAVADGYDSVRVVKATRILGGQFELVLGVDRTAGAAFDSF